MTDKEKQELYENICNDINCGTYILAPQYVDKLLAELKKTYRKQRNKRIDELQKENAKLKGLVNQYKASKCGSISLVNRNMIMFDQLTKAKEIIKNLMVYVPVDLKEYEEAKQFISEVEK